METKHTSPIPRCPWCRTRLKATKLHCNSCRVDFEGELPQVDLPDWESDEWEFVRTFLVSEGNLQLTGKTLGISYPTVKQRLAQVIKKINGKPRGVKKPATIADVLEALARGEIAEKEAENLIRKMKKGKTQ